MDVKFDFDKVSASKFPKRYRGVMKFLRDINYKVEYVGLENIPDDTGFIVASNHVQLLDPMILLLAFDKNKIVHFMGKQELFKKPVVGWIFKRCNAFPVARGTADIKALDYASKVIKDGHILGIFPEGTRSKDGNIQRAKRGISNIAAKCKCDVLPVSIYNGDNFKKHSKTIVRIGEIIPFEDLGLSGERSREEEKYAADYIMGKISDLREESRCGK